MYSLPGDQLRRCCDRQVRAGLAQLRAQQATLAHGGRRIGAMLVPPAVLARRRIAQARRAITDEIDEVLASMHLPVRLWSNAIWHITSTTAGLLGPLALHAAWLDVPYITSALERYDRVAASAGLSSGTRCLISGWWSSRCRCPGRETTGWLEQMAAASVAPELPVEVRERLDHPHLGWTFNSVWASALWPALRAQALAAECLWSPYLLPERTRPVLRAAAFDDSSPLALQMCFLSRWLAAAR